MRFVTPALKHLVFPALSKSGYLRYAAGEGPAVVTYHGVFPPGYKIRNAALDGNLVRADALRQQLQLLKRHYHVIRPEEFLSWSEPDSMEAEGEISELAHSQAMQSLPPRSILLTCDDALGNCLTEMVPILHDFGMTCLFFATGASVESSPSILWYEELYLMLLDAEEPIAVDLPEAMISTRLQSSGPEGRHGLWWSLIERLSQFGARSRRDFLDRIRRQLRISDGWSSQFFEDPTMAARFFVLDRTGLQQLAAAGMSVGAHTLSHPILARASDDLAWREISESKSALEEALGKPVWAFAYPFGTDETVSRRDLTFAEKAGFRCAFMNTGGGLGARHRRFSIPRVHVTADTSLPEFEASISGFYRRLRALRVGKQGDVSPT